MGRNCRLRNGYTWLRNCGTALRRAKRQSRSPLGSGLSWMVDLMDTKKDGERGRAARDGHLDIRKRLRVAKFTSDRRRKWPARMHRRGPGRSGSQPKSVPVEVTRVEFANDPDGADDNLDRNYSVAILKPYILFLRIDRPRSRRHLV